MNREDTYNSSDRESQLVTITVTGLSGVTRGGSYTLRVAYPNLSRTLQNLQRRGAKITNVSLETTAVSATNLTATPSTEPDAVERVVNPTPSPEKQHKTLLKRSRKPKVSRFAGVKIRRLARLSRRRKTRSKRLRLRHKTSVRKFS